MPHEGIRAAAGEFYSRNDVLSHRIRCVSQDIYGALISKNLCYFRREHFVKLDLITFVHILLNKSMFFWILTTF